MAISLTPETQNGIMVWTPTTLLLHLLWAWQFLVACAGEVSLLYAISYVTSSIAGSTPQNPGWLWIFFVLTLLVAILIIAEICLFANADLSPNLYLGLQTGKLCYAVLVFGLFVLFSKVPNQAYFWRFILGLVIYWPPWILSFYIAVIIKVTEHQPIKQLAAENVEAAPERAPLLPSQVPSPLAPSQRVAVQRYTS